MATLQVLQHVDYEDPGYISGWAYARGHTLEFSRVWVPGELFPDPKSVDGLIVLGGPMSVHDEDAHPWLKGEKRFIANAMAAGVPLLGICLGAQLIADVLGARVTPSPAREVGWFPVTFDQNVRLTGMSRPLPKSVTVFHWHGETYELPHGATRIAHSEAVPEQGFIIGDTVVGVQFHLEATPLQLARFAPYLHDEDASLTYVQAPSKIMSVAERHSGEANALLSMILDGLFAKAAERPRRR